MGATYDRTHTLQLDEMGGVGQRMRKMFAMWTACSLASLALPGMSGFVSELMVFVGFATDDAYSLAFRIVIDGAAAIGVILTPIYCSPCPGRSSLGKKNPSSPTPIWWMLSHGRSTSFPACWYRSLALALPEAGHRQLPGHD